MAQAKPRKKPAPRPAKEKLTAPLDTIHLSGTLSVYGATSETLQVIVTNESAPGRAYVIGIPVDWIRERIQLIDDAIHRQVEAEAAAREVAAE